MERSGEKNIQDLNSSQAIMERCYGYEIARLEEVSKIAKSRGTSLGVVTNKVDNKSYKKYEIKFGDKTLWVYILENSDNEGESVTVTLPDLENENCVLQNRNPVSIGFSKDNVDGEPIVGYRYGNCFAALQTFGKRYRYFTSSNPNHFRSATMSKQIETELEDARRCSKSGKRIPDHEYKKIQELSGILDSVINVKSAKTTVESLGFQALQGSSQGDLGKAKKAIESGQQIGFHGCEDNRRG